MDVSAIIISMLIVGVVGCLIGFLLCVASEKLKVEVDEREEAIMGVLPGNNCGGCGYAGCSGLAAAIVKGEAAVNQCPVGGDPVASQIGEIMGVDAGSGVRNVAYVHCAGNCDRAKDKYNYTGVGDCNMMAFVPGGGQKSCKYGCLGFGSCVKACPFDSIYIIDGIARIDQETCKACGKCIDACPKHLIDFIPFEARESVACMNKDKGKAVMSACDVGCIGCGICEKNCPKDAIHVVDNVAVIDQEKCIGCGICAKKCPKHIIEMIPKKKTQVKKGA